MSLIFVWFLQFVVLFHHLANKIWQLKFPIQSSLPNLQMCHAIVKEKKKVSQQKYQPTTK